jgi:hypothetical protein
MNDIKQKVTAMTYQIEHRLRTPPAQLPAYPSP